MNVSRTLQLPGAPGLAGPLREIGSPALDRRAKTWAPPDPTTKVVDPWVPPATQRPIGGFRLSPWPAPLASMRADLPIPVGRPVTTVAPLDVATMSAATFASMTPTTDLSPFSDTVAIVVPGGTIAFADTIALADTGEPIHAVGSPDLAAMAAAAPASTSWAMPDDSTPTQRVLGGRVSGRSPSNASTRSALPTPTADDLVRVDHDAGSASRDLSGRDRSGVSGYVLAAVVAGVGACAAAAALIFGLL